jgi:Family of unknown function (DUF5995)
MAHTEHQAIGPAASAFCEQLQAMPHDSLAALSLKMGEVANALPSVGLESVVPFAYAYGKLTRRAERALQAGAFTDAPTTERLACTFAGLYFDALTAHVSGKQDAVAMSWQQLLQAERPQPTWLQLALGVNAHIGHDLPLALQATNIPSGYGSNFLGINRAIKSVAPKLAPNFLPAVPHPLRLGVATVAAHVIVGWRQRAWNDFLSLEAGATNRSEIEYGAARRGRRLQKTAEALGVIGLMGNVR